MLSYMDVNLAEVNLRATPGGHVQTAVNVHNNSQSVDVFSIDVSGLADSWYELSVTSASLFPGDNLVSILTISPPQNSTAVAKTYPFHVRVQSQQSPDQVITLSATLLVDPFYSFSAALTRRGRVKASNSFTVGVSNDSNIDLTFQLGGEDSIGNLRYQFDAERQTVPPGVKRDVGLIVEPVARPLCGPRSLRDFKVRVSTEQGGVGPFLAPGRMEIVPRIPAPVWVVTLVISLATMLAVAGIAAVVWFLISEPDLPLFPWVKDLNLN